MARSAGPRASDPELRERLRALPSVEELAAPLRADGASAGLAARAARAAIEARREAIAAGRAEDAVGLEDEARAALAAASRLRLRLLTFSLDLPPDK